MAGHRFYYLLNVAQHALRRTAERRCQDELGITAVQLGALFVVGQSPECSQRELARALSLKESAIAGLVKRMVDAELLVRRVSEQDARARVLTLSPTGKALIGRARPLIQDMNQRLAAGYSEEELAVVARFLADVQRRFGEELP